MAFIKKGQKVRCLCSVFLSNGDCLDENDNNEPLRVIAGYIDKGNTISKSMSMELVGMSVNEVKYLKLPSIFAFGRRDTLENFEVSKHQNDVLSHDDESRMEVIVNSKSEMMDEKVLRVCGKYAYASARHPFAREALTLRVQVISFD